MQRRAFENGGRVLLYMNWTPRPLSRALANGGRLLLYMYCMPRPASCLCKWWKDIIVYRLDAKASSVPLRIVEGYYCIWSCGIGNDVGRVAACGGLYVKAGHG